MKHVYETATSRLKSTADALGQTTTYTYGLDDQPAGIAYTGAAVTTPNVTFAYETNYPRLSSMTMAGVGTISQAFVPIDPANSVYGDGQLATVTGLWGDVTTYTYDQLGRVTGRQINGANNPATAAYDALGRVTGWSNSLGSFSPSYLVAGNGALTGRADFVTLPNGGKTDLGWAAALGDYRLQQIKNVGAGAATLSQFDTVQNPVGQITQWKQWHSGLGAGVAARRHEIGYDAADQIIGDEVRDDVSNALVKAFSYRFDPAGNRTGEQVDASVTTGAFNAKNQLTNLNAGGTATVIGGVSEAATVKVNGDLVTLDAQRVWRKELTVAPGLNSFPVEATETSFTPGTVAQKTTKTLTLNVPTMPARTFAYNANGSLTSDGGTRSFEWDGANRLTKILYTGTNLTTELSYDGQSRCIKLVEKNGVAVTSEKRFVWTGLTMAEERNASNVVQKQFHGDGVRVGATNYYYTRDHLGSIREVTDSTGTVRTRYDYDPWGRRTKFSGGVGDPESDFGFTGHYFHVASGLHLAPFRQYDAGLGRFQPQAWIKWESSSRPLQVDHRRSSRARVFCWEGRKGSVCESCISYTISVRRSGGSYSTRLVTANHDNVNQVTSRTGGGGGGNTVAVEGTVSKPAKIAISQPALGQITLPASSVRAKGSAYAFSGTSAVRREQRGQSLNRAFCSRRRGEDRELAAGGARWLS